MGTPLRRQSSERSVPTRGRPVKRAPMTSVFLTNIRNCLPLSIVGYPAISVPAGYSGTGLPIGLQIVARPWEEGRLFSMAHGFEEATKCRRAPRLARV